MLDVHADGVYVDATFGRGGHSSGILQKLGDEGRLVAVDQDLQAIQHAHEVFADEPRFTIEHSNFSELAQVAARLGLVGKVDGVLMDLGVSSPQLDDAERGFSFMRPGPLDMRMDTSRGQTAAEWLARVKHGELARVLKKYGEEKFAGKIAGAIVDAREHTEINDTGELADIISAAVPIKEKNKHPATRSFQAIRIFINDELRAVEQGLKAAAELLAVNGRLVVISFHSLEDRIVKRFMRDVSSRPAIPKGLPVMDSDIDVPFRLVGKPVTASAQELASNPRARSARLRVLERWK